MKPLFDSMFYAAALGLVCLPFGLWKLGEIALWFFSRVRFDF